jgi:hypothetical protein
MRAPVAEIESRSRFTILQALGCHGTLAGADDGKGDAKATFRVGRAAGSLGGGSRCQAPDARSVVGVFHFDPIG